MTVANAAWILAGSGRRVLAIDWDLESPGLHRYFRPFLSDPELTKSRGLVDFLTEFRLRKNYPDWLDDCTLSLNCHLGRGSISLIPAGRQGEGYAERVDHLSREDARESIGGDKGIADLRDRLKSKYDYVLIDGPTGVGQSVEICNALIPDVLVALFTLNHKTITGTAAAAEKALSGSANELRIFPVPSRVEYGESEKLREATRYAREVFEPLISHAQTGVATAYWNDVEIPYVSYYAFEEVPPALRDEPGSPRGLTGSHERLLSRIAGQPITFAPPNEAQRQKLIRAYGFRGGPPLVPQSIEKVTPNSTQNRFPRRLGWRWQLVAAAVLVLLLSTVILIRLWPRNDAAAKISAMIDDLLKIEQTASKNDIELPKADLNRAYTSLRAIRDALKKPQTKEPTQAPNYP
jgi:MinD-like ATPase involved in chromosome partitioning or flagellar assembly